MIVRNLDFFDLNNILSCIKTHSTCYSIPINYEDLLNNFKHTIEKGMAYGVFDNDECIGCCTQNFYSQIPAWKLSNLYLKNNKDNLYLDKNKIQIIGFLMEKAIETAEKKDIYEFYYVIRDTNKFNRKSQGFDTILNSSPGVALRYNFENIHILKSLDDIKWDYLHKILGTIGKKALENKKTLVVRRATIKSEYRKFN